MKDKTMIYAAVPYDDEQPCCANEVSDHPQDVPKACCNRRRRMVRFALMIALIGYLSYEACCDQESNNKISNMMYSLRIPESSDSADSNDFKGHVSHHDYHSLKYHREGSDDKSSGKWHHGSHSGKYHRDHHGRGGSSKRNGHHAHQKGPSSSDSSSSDSSSFDSSKSQMFSKPFDTQSVDSTEDISDASVTSNVVTVTLNDQYKVMNPVPMESLETESGIVREEEQAAEEDTLNE